MTNLEFIAKLMAEIARTPALGECEANISVVTGDTYIHIDRNGLNIEIEGAR